MNNSNSNNNNNNKKHNIMFPPVLFYLLMGIISFLVALYRKCSVWMLLLKIIVIVLWTCLLQVICGYGYITLAWLLVLLPFVVMLGIYSIALETLIQQQKQQQS
jgi:hypothetical protein